MLKKRQDSLRRGSAASRLLVIRKTFGHFFTVKLFENTGGSFGEARGGTGEAGGNVLCFKLETRFLRLETPHENWGKRGGSRGEAWGKLGEAGYFWGKHVFCTLKFLEKTGEANPPSTLFIILNFDTQQG